MVNCEFVIYPMTVRNKYENVYMKIIYVINMTEIVILAVCFQLKQLKK